MDLPRVCVHTGEGGEADELAARRQSVEHLSKALAGKGRHLVLVDDEDEADLVLEVVDRGTTIPRVVIGLSPRADTISATGRPPARAVHLRVRLLSSGEAVMFTNKKTAIEQHGGWEAAAQDIATQVDAWIASHRDRILAAR